MSVKGFVLTIIFAICSVVFIFCFVSKIKPIIAIFIIAGLIFICLGLAIWQIYKILRDL
jgi:hypothetical protein